MERPLQRQQLRMGGRIVALHRFVVRFAQRLSIADDHRAYRDLLTDGGGPGQPESRLHSCQIAG
jgi:hypothetical protein